MSSSGQAALVIGAAQGIGYACAEALLQNGTKVLIGDINDEVGRKAEETLRARYGEGQVIYGHCDMTKDDHVQRVVNTCLEKFGRLDIFSPMAGLMDEIDWKKCVELNLVAVISSTYVVMKHLSKEHGGAGGVIIFISSIRGLQPFYGLAPVYGATKHGVIGFMQDWADENSYSVTGVRVGVLCPSLVDTELGRLVPTKSLRPEVCKKVFADLQMQSLKPCDVAQTFMRFVKEPDLHGKGLTVAMVAGEVNISLSQHAPF